jgi:sugar/nucleoside kinase (ribokinase family)
MNNELDLLGNDAGLAKSTAKQLRARGGNLEKVPSLLGFDGFIDSIYHIVDVRFSASEYSRVRTLADYGARIAAAAGKSTNIEMVGQGIKLGGNGPIMANALCALGAPVTYCGMTGFPMTHPVFAELQNRARLLPLSDPALTDAVEFDDGKLIVGKHENVAQVSYQNIIERVGEVAWRAAWQSSEFVAMVNWTMLPHLTALWKKLQEESPDNAARKTLFFDLADPEKRTDDDVLEALQTLAAFSREGDVLLGLNEKEGEHVARVLALQTDAATREERAEKTARAIREKLGIAVCVVHLTHCAAAASTRESALVGGPFTPKPLISTGAGDHFNAGFCVGHLLGAGLREALQCGVGTSGYYVRNAQSPTRTQLADFLDLLDEK